MKGFGGKALTTYAQGHVFRFPAYTEKLGMLAVELGGYLYDQPQSRQIDKLQVQYETN